MTRFFEGGPGGIPVEVWATPVFWWTCFLGAMSFAVFCLVVILRKQWVDHERLDFPLVEVGESLADTEVGGRLSQIIRSPLFWIAFGIVMTLKLWNVGSYFTPAFPPVSIEGGDWQAFPEFPFIGTKISFYAIGFGYFSRLDVLFSAWFFILLTAFQVYAFNIFGYTIGASTHHRTSDALGWQSIGALIFMAIWSLWMSRAHLKAVCRKAFDSRFQVDDSAELLSYRTAVFGFIGSIGFVAAWLHTAGMMWWVIFAFLSVAILMFVGLSKAVAELGLAYIFFRIEPHDAVLQTFGSSMVGLSGVTMLAFMRVFNFFPNIGKGFIMPAFTQAVKTVDKIAEPRRITTAIWLAIAFGYALSVFDTLHLCYTYGAYNLGNMGMKWVGPRAFNFAMSAIKNPLPFGGNGRTMWAGIGALTMAALTLIRYRMPWWPLHPIGLAMQGNHGIARTMFSIFIAWGMKSGIMRIGGVELYQKGKPFFIGLLAAQAVSTAVVFIVDCIWFPMQGHNVHNF